ncbi:MAG: DJ-1/PfpI family protein [Clostridiales Family XIII bacterium]|jgi:4-methyl-5(b-hydroxyethyl)-thiazole monophosphate biosynthesis|nr:DJ-1/PfpI family protein [Clostridiales Family XIII bacterium]
MVYIHLSDGFEEIEALTAFDLLKRAEIGVETVSVTGRLPVKGAHGVQVICDILFEDADYNTCEMIVLPGGMPGAKNLANHAGLMEKLYSFANQGGFIAAICASPGRVLGAHGILNGRRATCYPGFEKYLEDATFVDEKVVIDENLITSKGPATAIDFALAIIENLKGAEVRNQIAKDILYT